MASSAASQASSRRGVPFGPTKLSPELFGKPFTETKLDLDPGSAAKVLSEARAGGMRVFIILVGAQVHYKNTDGSFNLEMWKARVDRFRNVNFGEFVEDGTLLGHQLVSEAKAKSQWDGKVIPNAVLDEMARHSKERWPTMATILRSDPSELEEPGWEWKHLDTASARYLVRKGPAAKFAADEQASADRQKLALVVGLNVLSGGDGSSRIPSPAEKKWGMSPDELRRYGSAMLNLTKACAFEMWRYETPGTKFETVGYFQRPEISAAMGELAALAAQRPTRSCARPPK